MTGRRFLGVMLAVFGVVILSTSAAAAAPAAKKGGTVVVEMTTDVDYIDPQLSYYGETWKLEAATACKLLNWPDKEGAPGAIVTPEVAAGLPIISKDGKTYTFTIRSGFKFSNGQAVTAKSFVNAFNRFANPKMQSTGVQFIDIIQGAQAVIDGLGC
jgi:peptide/nickel transport system substrate-binding protein